MTCFASNFELRPRFSDPERNRGSPLQKRTYTFASDALHTLQRVHRDGNARARAFPTDAGADGRARFHESTQNERR
jgi:hypothetical protein